MWKRYLTTNTEYVWAASGEIIRRRLRRAARPRSAPRKVVILMGTRPEAIKLAPVVAAPCAGRRTSGARWWPPVSTRRCSGRWPRRSASRWTPTWT